MPADITHAEPDRDGLGDTGADVLGAGVGGVEDTLGTGLVGTGLVGTGDGLVLVGAGLVGAGLVGAGDDTPGVGLAGELCDGSGDGTTGGLGQPWPGGRVRHGIGLRPGCELTRHARPMAVGMRLGCAGVGQTKPAALSTGPWRSPDSHAISGEPLPASATDPPNTAAAITQNTAVTVTSFLDRLGLLGSGYLLCAPI